MDIHGAIELAKYYIESENWKVIEVEDEYYSITSKDQMGDDYEKYYEEVQELGYSLIFNTYSLDEEEWKFNIDLTLND